MLTVKHRRKIVKERVTLWNSKLVITVFITLGTSILLYLIFGIITSILPNQFFVRMTPIGWVEHLSLLVTSLLFGVYIGLLYYGRAAAKSKVCNATATTGGIFGFLTFGCSICNKILVFFLGITWVLTYFEPIRPLLGVLSIGLLGFAVFAKARNIFKSKSYY